MVNSLDNLDYTRITGEQFLSTPELDSSKGIVVDLSDFLGQQIWTIIYPEVVAQRRETVNRVYHEDGYNLDGHGKPTLTLQKLHFV
jgi:hypothetical protein